MISNKTLLATAISAVVLAGCGGDENSSDGSNTASSYTIKAIDGYLVNANVYADTNGDGHCETNTPITTTGAGGAATLDIALQGSIICIEAVKNQTIDEERGLVGSTYSIAAPPNSTVVTPITDLVVAKALDSMQNGETFDEVLDQARNDVVTKLTQVNNTNGDAVFTEEDLFSDYISAGNNHLEVIGETLADRAADSSTGDSIDTLLDIATSVTEEIKDIVDAVELDSYVPVIRLDDGIVTEVTLNVAPKVVKELADVTVEKDTAVAEFDLSSHFSDEGSIEEYLAFSLEGAPTLTVSAAGIVSGFDTSVKGEFKYQFFAVDYDGARSKPLEWVVTVEYEDDLPTVNESRAENLQMLIDADTLTQGEEFGGSTYFIDDLFNDDGKSQISYKVESNVPGLEVVFDVGGPSVVFEPSTPGTAGDYTVTVLASDESNSEWVKFDFDVTIEESAAPVVHPLENKVLYKIEADEQHGEAYCQSIKFQDGVAWFVDENETTQPIDPLERCAEPTVRIGTYTTDGEVITVSSTDNEGKPTTFEFTQVMSDVDNVFSERVEHIVGLSEDGEDSTHLFFEHKSDAENYLYPNNEYTNFRYHLPTEGSSEYISGFITLTTAQNSLEMRFGFKGETPTCSVIGSQFQNFALFDRFHNRISATTQCTEVSAEEVAINYSFNQDMVDGEAYTVIATHSRNDVISFGASFYYESDELDVCVDGDTGWNDDIDEPTELVSRDEFINITEACGYSYAGTSLSSLFVNGVSSIKLRRIDQNVNESEYMVFYPDSSSKDMYLALDLDGFIRGDWADDTSYGWTEFNTIEGDFEYMELLAITDYDMENKQISIKGFSSFSNWDSLELGTKAEGYGSIYSGVYEISFNDY